MKDTTGPEKMDTTKGHTENDKPKVITPEHKPRRRRLRVGDPDFVPPDGGWGWFVVFACGFSNLSTFPMFQQFGLVFRERFQQLGISSAETTSVINMNAAFNAGMGLINGPLFKKFSYRQVAMCGSLLIATSLFLCRFCDSFWGYIIFYSACFGCGIGITQSSNALALNTYFREKRRIATGLSCTTTALGPIVLPYIIVVTNNLYGVEGTLLIFSGFTLHAFVCSLLLQPVEWHTKFREPESAALIENGQTDAEIKATNERGNIRKNQSFFSSQYLLNEDDPIYTGYEIIDPGTPMLAKANDGWYSKSNMGSRQSLVSSKRLDSPGSNKPSATNLPEIGRNRSNSQAQLKRKLSQINKPTITEEKESEQNSEDDDNQTNKILQEAAALLNNQHEEDIDTVKEIYEEKLSIWQKISIFFGFELFKDTTYVNLMLGITIANFAEINFSILTPMVLQEFGFKKFETATFLSLLGAADILSRFFIPFIANKVGWENKTFFLMGVLTMAFGRVILVHTRTFYWGLAVAVIIGAGKGLRTVFIALVIPSYVPLERLPAASGLQLATSGFLFITLGPVVGWVRDAVDNYGVTLHILNICTYITAVAWICQDIFSRKKETTAEKKPAKSFKTSS